MSTVLEVGRVRRDGKGGRCAAIDSGMRIHRTLQQHIQPIFAHACGSGDVALFELINATADAQRKQCRHDSTGRERCGVFEDCSLVRDAQIRLDACALSTNNEKLQSDRTRVTV